MFKTLCRNKKIKILQTTSVSYSNAMTIKVEKAKNSKKFSIFWRKLSFQIDLLSSEIKK